MNKQPLVSVVVASYNAEHTVLETLESVRNQTYENIELILSDDCSKDNTVLVAQRWFDENAHYFKGGAHLLTAEKNQGVCANFNKAIRSSKGEWIKIIAADDLLLPNACLDYIQYINQNKDANYVTANIDVYLEHFKPECLCETGKQSAPLSIYKEDVEGQIHYAAKHMMVSGAAVFYSKTLFNDIQGYNERYPFEDWPSVINSLEHGYKIHHLQKSTIGYRHHSSISNTSGKLYNIKFRRSTRKFFKEKCFKYLDLKSKIKIIFQWFIEEFLEVTRLNYDNKLGRRIEHYISMIKKHF